MRELRLDNCASERDDIIPDCCILDTTLPNRDPNRLGFSAKVPVLNARDVLGAKDAAVRRPVVEDDGGDDRVGKDDGKACTDKSGVGGQINENNITEQEQVVTLRTMVEKEEVGLAIFSSRTAVLLLSWLARDVSRGKYQGKLGGKN